MSEGENPSATRKLGAALFADVVGYTRLMEEDEEGTHQAIANALREFESLSLEFGGRVLEVRGDGIFALFESAVNVVEFSVSIQQLFARRNDGVSRTRQIVFRIGIHLGEIWFQDDRPFGDCVNVASRLEGLAPSGGICISAQVHGQVRSQLPYEYESLGQQRLKNVRNLVEVYRVRLPEVERSDQPASDLPVIHSPDKDAAPDRPSVAVLPFSHLGDDDAEDDFADAITDDISSNLSRFRGLAVISHGLTLVYQGRKISPEEIRKSLGVQYVVLGSVRPTSSRARISIQLLDAETGRLLWAERYDRDTGDLFEVEDEITQIVVAAVANRIESSERNRPSQLAPPNLRPYSLVLQGHKHLFQYTKAENLKAREHFLAALELAPRYARAVAATSRTYTLEWRYGWSPTTSTEDALLRALTLAREAIALDETDARGFGELGYALLYRRQHDAAISAYTRALELNPNDADLISDMANALTHSGRPLEAIEWMERAMKLNPFYPDQYLWHLASACYDLCRYQEAVSTAMGMKNPRESYRLLAASHAQMGNLEQARGYAAKVRQVYPDFSVERWQSALPDRNAQDTQRYVEGLRKAGL